MSLKSKATCAKDGDTYPENYIYPSGTPKVTYLPILLVVTATNFSSWITLIHGSAPLYSSKITSNY